MVRRQEPRARHRAGRPADYEPVLDELRATGECQPPPAAAWPGRVRPHRRARQRDRRVVRRRRAWRAAALPEHHAPLPRTLHLSASLAQPLRYGENPIRSAPAIRSRATAAGTGPPSTAARRCRTSTCTTPMRPGGWSLPRRRPAAVIIKHANPCGGGGRRHHHRLRPGHECDPHLGLRGIVAVNRPVTLDMAKALAPVFTGGHRPGYEDEALMVLLEKRNLRVLTAPAPTVPALDVRSVDGGLLVQTRDLVTVDRSAWQVVTERHPSEQEWRTSSWRGGWWPGHVEHDRAGQGWSGRRGRRRSAEPGRRGASPAPRPTVGRAGSGGRATPSSRSATGSTRRRPGCDRR